MSGQAAELGVDWDCPIDVSSDDELTAAWQRVCRTLPKDAPDHCREMALQVALLIVKEDGYMAARGDPAEDQLAVDKALRDTVKLRSDLMKQIAVEGQVCQFRTAQSCRQGS